MVTDVGLKATVSIPLTKNQVALVDKEDYERISRYKWCVSESGRHTKRFYVKRREKGTTRNSYVFLHRQILNLPKGRIPSVDHINGNPLDNRKSNLRICSHQENLCNRIKNGGNATSRFKGVYWDKREKKWCARIWFKGKCKWIGYFNDEEEAAIAYNEFAKIKFGGFARLNEVQ